MGVILLAALLLGASIVTVPMSQTAEVADFAERARAHVEVIASEPHVMGTPQIDRVRSYLLATLTDAGLLPETQAVPAPDYFGVADGDVEVVNVLARIDGTAGGDEAIVLLAHYDTVPTTSGANDNSAAVAVLLEVAALLNRQPVRNDVIILLTDGEEPTPRYGATAFVEQHRWAPDVFLAVNFEGIGEAGPVLLVEMEGPQPELISRLDAAASDPVAFSFLTATADLVGGAATDFDVFKEAGIPGFNFAYLRGSSIYHTPRDDVGRLNVDGMTHQASLALGIARGFQAPEVGTGDDGAVFFTLPFGIVAHERLLYAYGALVVATILGVFAVARRTRGPTTTRRALAGTGAVAGMALAASAAGTGLWVIIAGGRPTMGVFEAYVYLVALIGLGAGGWVLVAHRVRRSGSDLVAGTIVVWLVLAVLLGVLVPGIGYLFVIPVGTAALVSLLTRSGRGFLQRSLVLLAVATTTAIIAIPAIDSYFLFATPRPGNPDSDLGFMIVIPLLVGFLSIALVASMDSSTTE